MPKTIRSFNASDEVNDIINEQNIGKGKISDWINDKIKKGVIYEQTPQESKPKVKGKVIGVSM